MPRASKTRTVAEIEIEPGMWSAVKDGFESVKEAEEWVRNHIEFTNQIRVARVSGVFSKTVVIAKR